RLSRRPRLRAPRSAFRVSRAGDRGRALPRFRHPRGRVRLPAVRPRRSRYGPGGGSRPRARAARHSAPRLHERAPALRGRERDPDLQGQRSVARPAHPPRGTIPAPFHGRSRGSPTQAGARRLTIHEEDSLPMLIAHRCSLVLGATLALGFASTSHAATPDSSKVNTSITQVHSGAPGGASMTPPKEFHPIPLPDSVGVDIQTSWRLRSRVGKAFWPAWVTHSPAPLVVRGSPYDYFVLHPDPP